MKICFVASSGGHMEELSRLRNMVNATDFVLTEKSDYNVVDWCSHVYEFSQINRKEKFFVVKFVRLFIYSLGILLKEQPKVIISTGSLVTFPISLLGKVLGKKIVYIESFARVEEGSLTGKLMYRIADLFVVQWEEMLRVYPKAKYVGAIF